MDDSSKISAQTEADTKAAAAAFNWSCHPVRKRPLVSVLVTLFVIFAVAYVYYSFDSVGFALLTLIVFSLSLARYYFPTHYRLSEKGVTIKTPTQTISKQWSEYRSFYPDKNGVLLSPFVEPSRLENFRGIYLMYGGKREQIISYINKYISSADSSSSKEGSG
ncbi:MAG: hypothetical protein IIA17_10975 [candidate division Zixibacteria bacterium]|nr:hypothetical protein [candidate division Zixibacteria bacterium]